MMLFRTIHIQLLMVLAASCGLANAAEQKETKNAVRISPEHRRLLRRQAQSRQQSSESAGKLTNKLKTNNFDLTDLFAARKLRAKMVQRKFDDLVDNLDWTVLEYLTRYANRYIPQGERTLFTQSFFDEYKKAEKPNRQEQEECLAAVEKKLFKNDDIEDFTTSLLMEAMVLRFTLLFYGYQDLVAELDLYVQRSIANFACKRTENACGYDV